jgi:DNA polymerase-3 subunit epsilon
MSSVPNFILVVDTETTGLLPKKQCAGISDYPKILQLAFVVYDVQLRTIAQTFNEYIRVSDDTVIEPIITEITGITAQICRVRGIPIEDALTAFHAAYMMCDCVVAHNINFDRKMIEIEIHRNFERLTHVTTMPFVFNQTFNDLHGIETYCTMAAGKDVCNLWIERNASKWKKSPKLSELHQQLFGNIPENLHDALADTIICLRCYVKIRHGIDL